MRMTSVPIFRKSRREPEICNARRQRRLLNQKRHKLAFYTEVLALKQVLVPRTAGDQEDVTVETEVLGTHPVIC